MLTAIENRIRDGKGLLKVTSFDADLIARNIAARLAHSYDYLRHLGQQLGQQEAKPDLLDFAEACRAYDLTLVPRFRSVPDGDALHGLVIKFDERFALSASQIIYRRDKGRSETLISLLADAGTGLPQDASRMAAFKALSDISYDDTLLKAEIRPETRDICAGYMKDAIAGSWLDRFPAETVGQGAGTLIVLSSDEKKYDRELGEYVPKLHNKVIRRNSDGSFDKLAYDNITTFRTRILSGIDAPADVPERTQDGIAIWGFPVEPDQAGPDAAPRRRIKDFQIRASHAARDDALSQEDRRKVARSVAASFWSLPHQDRCDIVDEMRNHGVKLPMFDAHTLKLEQPPEFLHGVYPKSKPVRELVERVFDPVDGVSLEISKAMMPTITRPPRGSTVFFVDMDKLPLSVLSDGLTFGYFIKNPEPHLRELIDRQFPPEFKDVRFAAKFSSSMGLAPARGKIGEFEVSGDDDQFSIHLFFLVETPVQFDALMRHIHDHQRDHLLPSMLEARLTGDISETEAAFCHEILKARGSDEPRYRYLSEAYLNGDMPFVDGLGRITDWKRMSDAERKQARRERAGIAQIDMALKSPNQPFYGSLPQCRDALTAERVPTALESLGGRNLVSVEGSRSGLRLDPDLLRNIEQEKRQNVRAALVRDSNHILLKLPSAEMTAGKAAADLDEILAPIRRRHAPQIGGIDSFNAPLFRYSIAAWSQIYACMPHLSGDWHDPELVQVRERLLGLIRDDITGAMHRGADSAKAMTYLNGKFESESYRQSWEHVQKTVGRIALERGKVTLDDLRTHFRHQDPATRRSMMGALLANTSDSDADGALSGYLKRTADGHDLLFDKDPKSGQLSAMLVVQTTEVLRVGDDRNSHVFLLTPEGGSESGQESKIDTLHVYGDVDSARRDRSGTGNMGKAGIAIAVFAGDDEQCLSEFGKRLAALSPTKVRVENELLRERLGQVAEMSDLEMEIRRPESRRFKFPPLPKTLPRGR